MNTLRFNKKHKHILNTDKRYILLIGGRGSGKSYLASSLMAYWLFTEKYFRALMMRFTLTDVRPSLFQDFKDRITDFNLAGLKVTDHSMDIRYQNNWIKAKGFRASVGSSALRLKSLAGVNTVFIDEVDEIPEDLFDSLNETLRTVKAPIRIVMCMNPPAEGISHWLARRFLNFEQSKTYADYYHVSAKDPSNTEVISSTYIENIKNLDNVMIETLENYKKTNMDRYLRMTKGLFGGKIEGAIFTTEDTTKAVFDAIQTKQQCIAVDFGYRDATAAMHLKLVGNKLYIHSLLHKTKMAFQDMVIEFKKFKATGMPIVVDSAAATIIASLRREGIRTIPAKKNRILDDIHLMQSLEIYITIGSNTCKSEFAGYKFKDGTETPIDARNHSIDATRYGFIFLRKPKGLLIK